MEAKSLRIVFMGTPHFAVESLKALINKGYNVVAVITAVDKPAGRGRKLQQSAVKQYALENNLPVLQPNNLKAEEFQAEYKSFEPDLALVVAFRMLPEAVISIPKIGSINLHGSLLPKYRGAAPIHWAVINGEKETGVTTFFIQYKIDTGNIILQQKMSIGADESVGQVHDRMMAIGAQLFCKTVETVAKGDYQLTKQDDSLATTAPKIFKDDCKINWNESTQTVYNFIRGMNPFPTAWTMLKDSTLKVYGCSMEVIEHEYLTGRLLTDNKSFIKVATKDGFIKLLEIQLQGKKRMKVGEFLNGYVV